MKRESGPGPGTSHGQRGQLHNGDLAIDLLSQHVTTSNQMSDINFMPNHLLLKTPQESQMSAKKKSMYQNNQEMNVTQILCQSNQVVNLKYDHLKGDAILVNMKKLGMLSGSKQAYENGITTQTEKILGSGNQTNPNIRLSAKEEEYVLSQLIQRNFDRRRGLSCFNSKS